MCTPPSSEALAVQHAGALLAGAGFELLQQAGLADARLAPDEDRRGALAGGPLERDVEHRELRATADEGGGGEATGHARHGRTDRRVLVSGARRGKAGAAFKEVRSRREHDRVGTITGRGGKRRRGDRERGLPYPPAQRARGSG